MEWTQIAAIVGIASTIGAFLGWLLPSPLEMQDRLSTVEKELAVLVSTVNTLRQTVDDWIRYTRGSNGNDSGGSGRRSRI